MNNAKVTCKFCSQIIHFRTSEWPLDMHNTWVHLRGEGVQTRLCLDGKNTATPNNTEGN